MAKNRKQPRPRAATPKGFRDYFGPEVTRRQEMLSRIAGVYHLYGFDALETSAVETVEALGKFLPDVDRPNEGVFAWQEGEAEGSGDWLALRYDLTAPLARVAAQYRADLPTPYRRYAMGPVWRNEKPGPGRFRQFTQCDADTVGSASMAADAEMCAMLSDVLESLGIARGDYVIRVNNRKILEGVIESVAQEIINASYPYGPPKTYGTGPGSPAGILARKDEWQAGLLRTIDKFDKVGELGVTKLLTAGRKDASGAFVEGVGLSDLQAKVVVEFLLSKGNDNEETFRNLRRSVSSSSVGMQGISELEEIANLLDAQGYGPDRIIIDPSVVRGLGYYTGPVYEAELTGEGLAQFGSVAGGGRYDDLVKRFTGQAVPATGVSIGVDRLLAALEAQGRFEGEAQGPVVVTVMDRDRIAEYQAMVGSFRQAGIRAELYLGNPKNFGNQLKYADRRGAPVAVIQGADEAARGVVQIKDLKLGAELAQGLTHEEWREQPAQVECSLADMVEEIGKRLS